MPLLQTRTEFTWRVVREGMDRFEVLDAYKREYLDPMKPPMPTGKDGRNAYIVNQWKEECARWDNAYHAIKEWLCRHPQARWEEM